MTAEPKPPPKTDPTWFYTFAELLREARERKYGERAFEVARGVFTKRTGVPCPFYPTRPQ